MKLTPVGFEIEDVAFRVTFALESGEVIAALHVEDSAYRLLASVLTMAWKLTPVDLLEGLLDGRLLNRCEFFRISYNQDPEAEEPVGVNLSEEDDDLNVRREFFREVVLEYAACHLELVGPDHFPWYEDLSPAARDLLTPQAG